MTLTKENNGTGSEKTTEITGLAEKKSRKTRTPKNSKSNGSKKKPQYTRVECGDIILYVDEKTKQCYQTQKGYCQLSGKQSSTIASRMKNAKRVKTTVYNKDVGRGVSTYLIPIVTVLKMLEKDAPELVDRVKAVAEEQGDSLVEKRLELPKKESKDDSKKESKDDLSELFENIAKTRDKPTSVEMSLPIGNTSINMTICTENGDPLFSWHSYTSNFSLNVKEEGNMIRVEALCPKNDKPIVS